MIIMFFNREEEIMVLLLNKNSERRFIPLNF